MTTYFDDIAKDSSDLLNKGFPAGGSFKVSTEVKTPNNITIASSAKRSFKKEKEIVDIVLEPKYTYTPYKIELSGKFTTGSEYSAGVSVKDVALAGSKLSVTRSHVAGNGSTKAAVNVSNDLVAVKTSVTLPDDNEENPIKANASLVATVAEGLLVGGSVDFATGFDDGVTQDAVTTFGAKASFGNVAASYTTGAKSEVTASFYSVRDLVNYAAQFVYKPETKASTAVFGADYKYASDTSIKSKVTVAEGEFRTGVALTQTWTTSSKVTIAADVNTLSLLGSNTGAAHSFGVEVKLL